MNNDTNIFYYAPQSVFLIHSLSILSICAPDLSLITTLMSKESFAHLKTPESFRASLYQVVCDMFDAFRIADSCMNKIHLSLKDLPDYFESALESINMVCF